MKTKLSDEKIDMIGLALALSLVSIVLFWGVPFLLETFPFLSNVFTVRMGNPLVPVPY